MRPVTDNTIITMNAATMASDTIATLSALNRFQASAHKPGETVCGISRGVVPTVCDFNTVLLAICEPPSLQLHARVDRLVHEIGAEIRGHRCKRDINRERLD